MTNYAPKRINSLFGRIGWLKTYVLLFNRKLMGCIHMGISYDVNSVQSISECGWDGKMAAILFKKKERKKKGKMAATPIRVDDA